MRTLARYQAHVSAALIVALIGTGTLAGCAKQPSGDTTTSPKTITSANLADKVDQARTPADHEALATYYDERASVEQREAAEERDAQSRYERRWSPDSHPMGRRAREHYGHMVEGREAEASRLHDMAEWHREMAAEARSEPPGRE